jgi:hypothetical protein
MTYEESSTPVECSQFQDQLPGYVESGAEIGQHPHVKTCERCSSLVRDLEYIAAQAKLLLPIHDPSPAVWNNIQSALSRESKTGKGHA